MKEPEAEVRVGEGRVIRHPVEREGIVGALFLPDSAGPHPAVLVLGGSEGGLQEGYAAAFAAEGFAALALAYFGIEPLPAELVEVPLEYFEEAVGWLREQPAVSPDRVAVVGGSKGGELALLLGATYPGHVRVVVANVPSGVVWQGITFDRRRMREGPRSSWTLGGEPVPFLPYARPTLPEMVGFFGFFLGRPVALRPLYERALTDEAALAAASIAVENVAGPVMLVSGTDDQMWPSTRLSEMVVERLRAHGHPFPYEHLRYEGAGHLILPPKAMPDEADVGRFKLGGSREANGAAGADSWPKMLDFLKRHLR